MMKRQAYEKLFRAVRAFPKGEEVLRIVGKAIIYITGILYFSVILAMLYQKAWLNAVILLFVPAGSFVMVSVFRRCCNVKRPYEVFSFLPLIRKDTKGKSFPSRHTFSVFVIAGMLFWFYPWMGIFLAVLGLLLAITRVVAGVHFPADVIAGAVIGLGCSCVGKLFLLLADEFL